MATLTEMSRAAGREGQDWYQFTFRDDVGALCDTSDNDIEAALAAWEEGNREHRIAVKGWVTYWTTAPADYDSFGTETIESGGTWFGRELRKVISHPHHVDYQRDRYGSGNHGSWDVDPRVAEAEEKAKRERQKQEDEERARRERKRSLKLQAMTDDELDKFDDDPGGVSYTEIRDERRKRTDARESAAREEAWVKACALVPEGCTILDNGTEGFRGIYGYIKGNPTHVYYSIHYEGDYTRDVEKTDVVDTNNLSRIYLAYAADWIQSGRMKIVTPDEVPPQKVVERIGHENVKKIKRYEVCGRVVWVGRPSFESLVLDENGRSVRAKKVIETLTELGAFAW